MTTDTRNFQVFHAEAILEQINEVRMQLLLQSEEGIDTNEVDISNT